MTTTTATSAHQCALTSAATGSSLPSGRPRAGQSSSVVLEVITRGRLAPASQHEDSSRPAQPVPGTVYLLIDLLVSEASLVDYQVQLMKQSTILRRQRRNSKSATARLFAIWEGLVDIKGTCARRSVLQPM